VALNQQVNVLWRNRPMREVISFRNFKERDCATVAERYRVLPPLPFPRFMSLRVLLGYAVITWLRKDDVTSVTSCATIHNATFSACQIRALIGETEVQLQYKLLVRASKVRIEECRTIVRTEQLLVRASKVRVE
jgi:hypothetical protein